jgi:tetratricopeptide (TPR) repeat protein
VLKSSPNLQYLEIYKNFISILANGVQEKKDFKKITEIVIFTEDFKLQALILNLLLKEGLDEVAKDLAQEMRQNKEYNYVYLDKYLPQLKSFFFQPAVKNLIPVARLLTDSDLKLEKASPYQQAEEETMEISDEEELLSQLLKHQSFSSNELLDIAVSFVQAEFYKAALKAAEMAFSLTEEVEIRLKANYLKVTCLLKTGDYRAALDVSLGALSYSITQNDILSFLYSQAEAHLKLKEYKDAKRILKKILIIDANYRMTKERLERLDAI